MNPGLCGDCVHARVVESRRGSRFYLCGLSAVDPRFPKYPRLPVLRCGGYRPEVEEAEDLDARPPPDAASGRPGAGSDSYR